ncbi:multidrug resistance-associated protein 6 [Tanacetum coccineum]
MAEGRYIGSNKLSILKHKFLADGVMHSFSPETNEAYLFFHNEYVVLNYAPGTTNDWVVNGPLYIQNGFHSLVATPFAENGIDAAFGCHDDHDESFIFSGSICAKIDYAPGTTNDKILEGPCLIDKMGANMFKGKPSHVIFALFTLGPNQKEYIIKPGSWFPRKIVLITGFLLVNILPRYNAGVDMLTLPEEFRAGPHPEHDRFHLSGVKVSFGRITSFLVDDELKDNKLTTKQETKKSTNNIRIQDGNFAWDPESTTPTLRNVNLEVKRGQKVAVCGSVGSGKSSMLYATLGEISRTSGTPNRSSSKWEAPRYIILFGKHMIRIMYDKGHKACAWDKDMSI